MEQRAKCHIAAVYGNGGTGGGHQQMTEQASLGVAQSLQDRTPTPAKVELAAYENRRGSERSRCLLLR